jgi:hypothetical protein
VRPAGSVTQRAMRIHIHAPVSSKHAHMRRSPDPRWTPCALRPRVSAACAPCQPDRAVAPRTGYSRSAALWQSRAAGTGPRWHRAERAPIAVDARCHTQTHFALARYERATTQEGVTCVQLRSRLLVDVHRSPPMREREQESDDDGESERARERESERAEERERQRESKRARETVRERARERESERARERESERASERKSEKTRKQESERARERESERARERARERESERARERESERASERESERETARERESQRARAGARERGESARESARKSEREKWGEERARARASERERARERARARDSERTVPRRARYLRACVLVSDLNALAPLASGRCC